MSTIPLPWTKQLFRPAWRQYRRSWRDGAIDLQRLVSLTQRTLLTVLLLLVWFGWTGYNPNVHWIVPALAGILIGFGLLSIFLQSLNYLVDAYLMVSLAVLQRGHLAF